MARSNDLRERAGQALERAREIERREAESPDPLPAEDRQAHAAAMQEFNELLQQADEIDQRALATADAARRIEESRGRASTPVGRRGAPAALDSDDGTPMPHTDRRNTRGGLHGYSYMRALRAFAEADGADGLDGIEAEVHAELAKAKRTAPQGILVPINAPLCRDLSMDRRLRATGVLDTTDAAGAIQTTVVPTLIDYLRAQLVTARLGATIMTGMSGPFGLPKQTATTSGGWVTEGSDVPASKAAIGSVPFVPKTVGGLTTLTRKFILQSSIDAESFAQADIVKTIQYHMESAALNGSGVAPIPKGILQYGGAIGTVAVGANGGPLTWALVNQMIAKVNTANAMSDRRAFLFNELTASKLRSTPKEAGQAVYILQDRQVGDFPVDTTTLLPSNLTKGTTTGTCSAAIYGNWSDLVIAMFSGIDIVWDPYTPAASGGLRLVAMLDADINLRYPEAFCICTDVTTV